MDMEVCAFDERFCHPPPGVLDFDTIGTAGDSGRPETRGGRGDRGGAKGGSPKRSHAGHPARTCIAFSTHTCNSAVSELNFRAPLARAMSRPEEARADDLVAHHLHGRRSWFTVPPVSHRTCDRFGDHPPLRSTINPLGCEEGALVFRVKAIPRQMLTSFSTSNAKAWMSRDLRRAVRGRRGGGRRPAIHDHTRGAVFDDQV